MTTRKCLTALLVISICCHVCAGNAHAAWSSDPSVNTAICTAAGDQYDPAIISDGSGGAIITWPDERSENFDIYAQRINASGVVQWTLNGVAICTAAGDQENTAIISDDSGGAIITWTDHSNDTGDIYAQRVNANGVAQWTLNGVAICLAADHQYYPTLISDGSGGAFITWMDRRNGSDYHIYAQRINSSGVVQWTTDGVAICSAAGGQVSPQIINDGSGGAIITWFDYRSGSNIDIYAQRINAGGVVQWAADGVAICTAAGDQYEPTIISDGSGGVFITWIDRRNGSDYHIYAQRINAGGVVQWTADGVAICTAAGDKLTSTIISDGSGGAIITWTDSRNGSDYHIYAQRINAGGSVQWATDGVVICAAAGAHQYGATIISDGSGGAIITWPDYRNGDIGDIYAQRINAGGSVQWATDGVAICTAAGDQDNPRMISDGSGGAIITWKDFRSGNSHIYAQRIYASGSLLLLKGDVNCDGQVDLADAILCLQVLSGLTPDHIYSTVDVDGDGKIGMAEAIYSIQKVAGLQ